MVVLLILAFLFLGFVQLSRARIGSFDYNCSDFDTQDKAQRVFEKHSDDIYRLDGDNDGIACEEMR